ncbi:MAG: 50S ribosomal protein L13 [Bacteriovoracales bacterium]|nr:50S ribosomal protein L13 [Bacteriovoracales bacterium]
MIKQKSFYPKQASLDSKWFEVNAEGKVVGRLASKLASILRGKCNPGFTPSVDCGDFVIVTNAKKVRLTGNKMEQKKYYRHSGFIGGLKSKKAKELLENRPELVIAKAVKGMLPKTALGRKQLKKLKIYSGSEHPHVSQKPERLEI